MRTIEISRGPSMFSESTCPLCNSDLSRPSSQPAAETGAAGPDPKNFSSDSDNSAIDVLPPGRPGRDRLV